MDNTIKVRQGETFQQAVTSDDTSASSVKISVWNATDGTSVFTVSQNFTNVNGQMQATLKQDINAEPGKYKYMYTVTDADGNKDKLPDPGEATDITSLPDFLVFDSDSSI